MKLNVFGNVCSIVGLLIVIMQLISPESYIVYSLIVVLILICIIFIVSNRTQKKYLKALKRLQDFHYKILIKQNGYNQYTLDECVKNLQEVCSDISEIFKEIKKNQVSVCIKYTNKSDDECLYVKTLARDKQSLKGNKRTIYDTLIDKINDNTDFLELYKKIIEAGDDWQEVFYFAKFLPQKHQYNNSHLDKEGLPDEWYSWFSRNRKWPLSYKSTIVVPIISDGKKNIYGYLCVDSEKNNEFKKEYDVKLLQNIALIISQTIKNISEKQLIKI